ncbi:membrane protein [Polycladomyces abyssicola]|uniref:Membrane protein n=1 Tax=Polycladomyces abyssicola TaxID=1125966 RepID=A0A8D5UI07_9BACL|nr:DedA family protein [Polycladomyces abyssicola]BCU82821.1 membrane protein [Polycladomyces abyssicola]
MQIDALIKHYGYGGIFVILLLEMIGIPFPGETILTLSGIEWTIGTFSLLPLLGVAISGNVIGSSIAYGIGRFLGRPVILRYGRLLGITDERLNKAEVKFKKYRIPVILFSKFIAGIRVLVPYLAGINRMSFVAFSIYNFISATLWSVVFIVLGRYLDIAWYRYHQVIHQFLLPALIVTIISVGVYFILKTSNKRRGN